MREPVRVIIVHSAEQAAHALREAAQAGKEAWLQSAPGAIAYCGSLYLKRMVERAVKEAPGVSYRFIIDCGDSPGFCLGALADGHKHIRFKGDEAVMERLQSIALAYGALLYARPVGEYGADDFQDRVSYSSN